MRYVKDGCWTYQLKASLVDELADAPTFHAATSKHSLDTYRIERLKFEMTRVHWNNASTFPGLCNEHDKIFRPLDLHPDRHDWLSCALYSYRALLLTFSECKSIIDLFAQDRERAEAQSFLAQNYDAILRNTTKVEIAMRRMEQMIISQTPDDDFSFVVFKLDQNPHFATAGALGHPIGQKGFLGEVTDVDLEILHTATLTVVPRENKGYAVFSWIGSLESSNNVLDNISIFGLENISELSLLLAFDTVSNTFLHPSLWENLPAEARRSLMTLATNVHRAEQAKDDLLSSTLGSVTSRVLCFGRGHEIDSTVDRHQ